jgi:signal transduction histidine kinase/HAMP domain-containing protein
MARASTLVPTQPRAQIPSRRKSNTGYLRSIRVPLLLVLALSVIIPALLVSAFSAAVNVNSALTRAQEQLATVNTLKSAQIGLWTEQLRSELSAIGSDPAFVLAVRQAVPNSPFPTLREQAQDSIEATYRAAVSRSTQLNALYLLTETGEKIVSTSLAAPRYSEFESIAPGQMALYGPEAQASGAIQMFAWFPVYDGDRFLAMLGGSVNSQALFRILLDRSGTGLTVRTYLADAEGDLLTPVIDEGYMGLDLQVSLPAEITYDQNGQAILTDFKSYRRTDTLAIANNTLPMPAVLITEQAQDEVLSPVYLTLTGSVAVTVAAVLLVIVMGTYFIERGIVRPVKDLSKTANQISSGELDKRVKISRDDEIGVMADSFNTMTDQLQDVIANLEDRVQLRTRDLQLAADVSKQVTTVLDIDALLSQIVEQVRETFGFYHVSVFVFDPEQQTLNLRAATGEAGRMMLKHGRTFKLHRDSGIVPLSASNRSHRLTNDTTLSREHVFNEFLAQTRAELALPMVVGDTLVGVLDLQSEQVDRFQDDDIQVLNTLAEQIAIAIRNAQLFEQVQDALSRAEQANSVKSHFLASMSHELRTPLNAIINFTKFVLKEKMGPINERQADALDKVASSGIHLLNLINDVLDISKIESGTLNLIVENDVDVQALVERSVATSYALLEGKPVDLRTQIASELPLIVADKQRILQIMLNMLSNACKFTETGWVEVRAYASDDQVIIEVEDTGPGIEVADYAAVFETFKQTQTGLRKGAGTGLGMPISRSLAEAHGGTLTLQSEVDRGSCFTLTLPVKSDKLEPNFA